MIPLVLLKGVEPVVAAKSAVGGRADPLRLLPQFDPGEILSARVEARLPDGHYKVTLAGQTLRMDLPSYIGAGDTLELAFVAREPRLTFVLKDVTQAAAPQLSAAGRLVAATMLPPGATALPLTASAIAPLFAAAPADGARLSDALAQTLAHSGLFYESHQAEWLAGARDLAQLQQEPQARLAQGIPARDAAPATQSAASVAIAQLPTALQAQHQDQSIDPRTLALVQQQLTTLDSAKVALQLEIWPGQWLHWEVDEDQPGKGRSPDTPPNWNTQLRLDLPQLGELKATLSLCGGSVRIKLDAASAASAALMQDECASLHGALAGAGVPASGIVIAHHEPL